MQFYGFMKRQVLLFLAVAVFAVSGCDFFRSLAGRPTSEDIEMKKIEILRAEEAALQARLDSLKNVEQKMMQDSLNALDSIRQIGGSVLNPAKYGGLFATRLEARYYVIIGAFRTRTNAENLLRTAKEKGYRPALISFQSGMIAVGLSPVNKLTDALTELKKVKKEPFCPKDAWILVNE